MEEIHRVTGRLVRVCPMTEEVHEFTWRDVSQAK
jgi:hypothetical protein